MKNILGFPVEETDPVIWHEPMVLASLDDYVRRFGVGVERQGDNLILTWRDTPRLGDVFDVTMDGESFQLVVTAVSPDGKTCSMARRD